MKSDPSETDPWKLVPAEFGSGSLDLCIDPGLERTAWAAMGEPPRPVVAGYEWNGDLLLSWLRGGNLLAVRRVLIEVMESRGNARAGSDQHVTNLWAGRYWEAAAARGAHVILLGRDTVKRAVTRQGRARDATVAAGIRSWYAERTGLEDPVGTKARPGPLFGVARDQWQALALGVYMALERRKDA